jgi:hypothetical protein
MTKNYTTDIPASGPISLVEFLVVLLVGPPLLCLAGVHSQLLAEQFVLILESLRGLLRPPFLRRDSRGDALARAEAGALHHPCRLGLSCVGRGELLVLLEIVRAAPHAARRVAEAEVATGVQ